MIGLTEIIISGISAAAGILSAVLVNKRAKLSEVRNDFKMLVDANTKFREEMRGDLNRARKRIDDLEHELQITRDTTLSLQKQLDNARETISQLRSEIQQKDIIIRTLVEKK